MAKDKYNVYDWCDGVHKSRPRNSMVLCDNTNICDFYKNFDIDTIVSESDKIKFHSIINFKKCELYRVDINYRPQD